MYGVCCEFRLRNSRRERNHGALAESRCGLLVYINGQGHAPTGKVRGR